MADTEITATTTETTTSTTVAKEEEDQNPGIPDASVWLERGKCSGSKDYLWWCVNQIDEGKLDNILNEDGTHKYPDDVQQQLVSHMIRGIHQCVEWQNEDELEEEEREPAADKLDGYIRRWANQKKIWDKAYEEKQKAKRKRRRRRRKKKKDETKSEVKAKDGEVKAEDSEVKAKDELKAEDSEAKAKDEVKAKDDEVKAEDGEQDDKPLYVVFPSKNPPDEMPELKNHRNYMGEVLHANPNIYDELKNSKTSNSVDLARCIKTGVENPDKFFVKPSGLVAGDIQSFRTFKKLFDPVLQKCHENFSPESKQETSLDDSGKFNLANLDTDDLDPDGKYVASVRLSTGRSIDGYCLPPSIMFTQRREIETSIMRALESLQGEIKGEYYPLQYQKKLKKTSEEKFKKNKEDQEVTKRQLEEAKEKEKKLKDNKEKSDSDKKEDLDKATKEVEEKKEKLKELQKEITDDDYSLLDGSRSVPEKLFGISKEKEDKLRASIVLVIDARKAYIDFKEAEEKAKKARRLIND